MEVVLTNKVPWLMTSAGGSVGLVAATYKAKLSLAHLLLVKTCRASLRELHARDTSPFFVNEEPLCDIDLNLRPKA